MLPFVRCWMVGACLLAAGACAAQQQQLLVTLDPQHDGSWWTGMDLQPQSTVIHGIPVQQLDRQWCKADTFTQDVFLDAIRGIESAQQIWLVENTRFSMSGTFGSGERLEVILGVFETCRGERADFLLVLAPERGSGAERIVQVERVSTRAVLLYLVKRFSNQGFAIVSCYQCDDMGSRYKWDTTAGKFVKVPALPVEPA